MVKYQIGVYRDGKLLFPVLNPAPSYAWAALVIEMMPPLSLKPGDYVACEQIKTH